MIREWDCNRFAMAPSSVRCGDSEIEHATFIPKSTFYFMLNTLSLVRVKSPLQRGVDLRECSYVVLKSIDTGIRLA